MSEIELAMNGNFMVVICPECEKKYRAGMTDGIEHTVTTGLRSATAVKEKRPPNPHYYNYVHQTCVEHETSRETPLPRRPGVRAFALK